MRVCKSTSKKILAVHCLLSQNNLQRKIYYLIWKLWIYKMDHPKLVYYILYQTGKKNLLVHKRVYILRLTTSLAAHGV